MTLNFARLQPHVAGLLVVLLFGAVVAGSVAAGYWERGRTFPGAVEVGGRIVEEAHPSLRGVRASHTLDQVAEQSGLTLAEIRAALKLPDDLDEKTTVREVSEQTGQSRRDLLLLLGELLAD